MAQNKKRDVILSVVFSVLLLVAFLTYLNKDLIAKKFKSRTVEIPDASYIPSQFPLSKNGIDAYAFSCTVVDVLYPSYVTQLDYIVQVGVTCSYTDANGNIQEINVPLVLENQDGFRVVQGYYQDYALPLYKGTDLMKIVERKFYIENSRYTSALYDDPSEKNYWDSDAITPTIDPGDGVVVTFVMPDSIMMTTEVPSEEWKGRIDFAVNYHKNVYTYEKIQEFLESGDPKKIDTENDSWIIPSWAKFTKDNNPPQ